MTPLGDDDWLRALRGEAGPDPRGAPEVEALRAAIAAAEAEPCAMADELRLRRLRLRLQREGLLRAAPAADRRRRPAWIAAAAAAVLGLSLTLALIVPQEPALEPTTRGAGGEQTIEVDDPIGFAQLVAAELRALGVSPVVHADPTTAAAAVEVNATVAPDQQERARRELARLGVELPADGRLSLWIKRRDP